MNKINTSNLFEDDLEMVINLLTPAKCSNKKRAP